MPLISSFYGMYINSQDFSCLLENQPFLPKTLLVFWKIGLFYQRRQLSFGKSAFFTKDVKGFSEATIRFIKNTMLSDSCSIEQTTFYLSSLFIQRWLIATSSYFVRFFRIFSWLCFSFSLYLAQLHIYNKISSAYRLTSIVIQQYLWYPKLPDAMCTAFLFSTLCCILLEQIL